MAELESKVKERRIYRDKLLDKTHPPSKTTPQEIARYSHLNGELERIEEDIARLEGDSGGSGMPPEDEAD
jgi:hypothetical protein